MHSTSKIVQLNLTSEAWTNLESFYRGKNVTITGGASFIGSHVVELILSLGGQVTIVDDFSSGRIENINHLVEQVNVIEGDLRDRDFALISLVDAEIVFHLAAIHGGRGFIEKYKQEMLANLVIDNNVFSSGVENKVVSMVHASSACAYPVNLQSSDKDLKFLRENQASMEYPETSFADGVYGWTKLIGEYQLENHCNNSAMKGRSARIFTAYGERENESHAAIALIAKCLLKADPFPIWGNGEQTRNFTYVADTAIGLALLGSDARTVKFDVFNIGTSEHVKIIDFVRELFTQCNWVPSVIDFQLHKPVGVASRASDNAKILHVFDWAPKIGISQGLSRTLEWYSNLDARPKTLKSLEDKLNAR